MKILKGILTGIGVLTVLMCALILLSSVNPGITRTLSSLASGNGLPSKEEEEPEEERGGQDSFVGQHEDNFPDMLSQTEEEPEDRKSVV